MKNENPLNSIFIKDTNGKLTEEIDSIKNIHKFFDFLIDNKINNESKIKIIDEFKAKLHNNRYIAEFFSSYKNKSIYFYLFDLYLNKNSNDKQRASIQSLIEELCLNIQTEKNIFEFLFQNMAKIYRGEMPTSSLYNYLKLLNIILSENDNILNPKNYFACAGGNCKFFLDLKESDIEIGYSFTINITFKIGENKANSSKNKESNLIKLYFSNKKDLSIDLKYPSSLIIKSVKNEPITNLANYGWINLNITINNINNKINLFVNVNGESAPNNIFNLNNLAIKYDDTIEKIEFFNNFCGEVSSIYMFSQKESGPPAGNSAEYLSKLKEYKEGLWKRKLIENFLKDIYQIYSVDVKSKSVYFKSSKLGSKGDSRKSLYDNLVFLFTPINYYKTNNDKVEDAFGNYILQMNGNIQNHLFQNYQKKLIYVSDMSNFLPIAELFLIYPESLTEQNLELLLNIISNALNFRKQNLRVIKQCKIFYILSLFIEKFPQKIFTQKILNAFFQLAKILFSNNFETTICSNYFKHILLNEKILSKYDNDLQIKFWDQLFLFCQSDITQIETFININRLCLILRFYDRNKYYEICCEEHLNMIKPEYVGSKKIMNPNMLQKLSNLKNIMDLIIGSQDPQNAISLFKLLTLDLSPCLVKFILNIFIQVLKSNKNDDNETNDKNEKKDKKSKKGKNKNKKEKNKEQDKTDEKEKWKDKFIEQLLQSKYEVIIVNTFIHSLPDIRIELLKFVYQVHLRLILTKNTNNFNIFEKMIKTCLLPGTMFYYGNSPNNILQKTNNINSNFSNLKKIEPKKEFPKKLEPKKEEIKKFEPKKEEAKKIETKKEPPKKLQINKMFEPKKEDNTRLQTEPGGGRKNFLALLSKFDNPTSNNSNNDFKKSANIKQPNKIDKPTLNPSSNSSIKQANLNIKQNQEQKKITNEKEEFLKEQKKNLTKIKEEKPSIQGNKLEKKNALFPSTNPIASNKPNLNIAKPNISNNAPISQKNINNSISSAKSNSRAESDIFNNTSLYNINYFGQINTEGGVMIIKDSEMNKYIKKLYSVFMLWSMTEDIDSSLEKIDLDKKNIKVINTIEIICLLNKMTKNKELILNFLKTIKKLADKPENCFEIFFNKKVYSSFLDLTFENYLKKGKEDIEIFNIGKNILMSLFINSLIYCEKQPNLNPGNEIETILLWGNKVLQENNSKESENIILEFIHELFYELLIEFKIKFEVDIKIDIKDFNIEKNYLLKNYLMLITEIFIFILRFKQDPEIHKSGTSFLFYTGKKIFLPTLLTSMRMNPKLCNEISKDWLDFNLIHDIFNRYKFIWVKNNVFKKLDVDKYKNNKSDKYDYIIENIILSKDKKNIFQKELTLLFFEDKKGDFEYIIPLTKLILQTLMYILEFLKNTKNEKEFLAWLKDLKGFIRFIIIASCNLAKHNQSDFYKSIQEKCFEPICAGLIFMQNLCLLSNICKPKIEKSLNSLLLFCFKLIKCQFTNENKHKKLFKLVIKEKSDIGSSAIIQLFNDYIKDKSGNPLMNSSKLESIPLDDNKNCLSSINSLRISEEFVNAFWDNPNLKNKLYNGFYSLNSYKKAVDYRFDLIPYLLETFDDSYKKTILTLLPKYETELAKYSNNSLEKNIKIKNQYKAFKKKAFSWKGYWSSRELFFTENPPFKYKLINHYTKSFMKPILVPILDISYYLPEFSGFDPKNLFKAEKNENKKRFTINLDIDKVLKNYDQNIQDNSKEKKESNKENYLGNIYKKSNMTLYEKYLKIANNLEFGKEEEFSYIGREESNKNNISKEEQKKKYYLCCLVKTSHHIKGVCFIDDNRLNFKVFLNQKTGSAMSGVEVGFTTNDDDYDQERKTCFGSYFVCHPKDKDLYNITINYADIKWIFKRRYYYTDSAFEIYTTTNKVFYFNLKYEKDREPVLEEILNKLGDYAIIIDDLKENSSSKENVVGYENGIIQKKKKDKIKLSSKLKQWKNWEITNFEFLMWLNIFGNRSYNDISQYPVFPWILSSYEDPLQKEKSINKKNENIEHLDLLNSKIVSYQEDNYGLDYQYRDMSLPMGMMELNEEGKKRKELFLETYDTLKTDPDANIKPYIYGSNYSNPVYVCNYLMRLFPFTHISIELQGHKFDDPNRLFISVKNSFYNSITQKTDVRELIPEFFYLPEIFRNINKLNMGKLETGKEVNDVETPCNDNPYDFIMTMKSVLESNKISRTIQNWIDLIFGYKARGKDAENANNIFSQASYQESININEIENKESYLRMIEFGLIPSQIMTKECGKREKKESIKKGKEITNSSCDLKCYNCKLHNESDGSKKVSKNVTVLEMVSFASEKVLLFLNNDKIIEKKINYSTLSYEDSNSISLFKYVNKMRDYYNPKISNNKTFKFLQKGKVLIMGGFYDGKVEIISVDQKAAFNLLPFSDKLPIVSICADKNEEFAFFGNSIGNVRVLKLEKEYKNFKYLNTITDHLSEISHIDCNIELNLWASASIDGYINLYTFPLSKLIRSIKIPTTKCDYIFLSASPLPSIVVITEEKIKEKIISEIFVYSINGKFLMRQKEPELLSCPRIITDLNSNDYLAYILSETIITRSIPTLIRQTCTDPIPNLYAFYQSEDMKYLYATNKSGNEIFVIKDK